MTVAIYGARKLGQGSFPEDFVHSPSINKLWIIFLIWIHVLVGLI